MVGKYILTPEGEVRAASLMEWAAWFETADRCIAKTKSGDATISTVFLGLDHRFGESGPPVLWETMVFGGSLDGEQDSYTSLVAAQKGHEDMVERVKTANS